MNDPSDHSFTLEPDEHSGVGPQFQAKLPFLLCAILRVLVSSDADELVEDIAAEIGLDAASVVGKLEVEHEARTVLGVLLAIEAVAELPARLHFPLAGQAGLVTASFPHAGDAATALGREYSI
jgi:hypothetical protein